MGAKGQSFPAKAQRRKEGTGKSAKRQESSLSHSLYFHIQNIAYVKYILYLTCILHERNVNLNRVWLTPFSAPLELSRSPEVKSYHPRL